MRQICIDKANHHLLVSGKFPDIKEWKTKNSFPCAKNTVIKLFGSWRSFRRAVLNDRYTIETNAEMIEWIKQQCEIIGECWIWQRVSDGNYGKTMWKGRYWLVHRLVYFLTIGSIDKEKEVCHTCGKGLCCNPGHLTEGTHKENMQDSVDRSSCQRSIRKPTHITEENLLLWVKNVINGSGECWIYPGCSKNGYSSIYYNNRKLYLHRLICSITHNLDYDSGAWIARHSCNNKKCVNPKHVIPGSRRDNAMDLLKHRQNQNFAREDLEAAYAGILKNWEGEIIVT